MKIAHHPSEYYSRTPGHSSGGGLLQIARAWDRFWFKPADPLPLGVIRVFTGLVILYVHLIYSLDLLAMVAPDGWLNKPTVDWLREEVPAYHVPSDWYAD